MTFVYGLVSPNPTLSGLSQAFCVRHGFWEIDLCLWDLCFCTFNEHSPNSVIFKEARFHRSGASGLGTISASSPQLALTCEAATRKGDQITMTSGAFGIWCRKRLRKARLRACCLGRGLLPSFAAPVPRSTANAEPSPRPFAQTRTSGPRRSWTSRVRCVNGEGAAS